MEDLLSTNELIDMVEKSRNTVDLASNNATQMKHPKIIYWIMVGIVSLLIIYIALPTFIDKASLVQAFGVQPAAAAKYGQTPPKLDLTVIVVEKYDYENVKIGDLVVVYSEENGVYLEKKVTHIDLINHSFQASYIGDTADTYQQDELVGVNVRDAGFLQMVLYAMSSSGGFIGTVCFNIIIFSVSYSLLFKKPKIQDKDSDFNE